MAEARQGKQMPAAAASDERTADSDASPPAASVPPAEMPSQQPADRSARTRRVLWRAGVPLVALVAGLMFGVSSHAAKGTSLRTTNADLTDVVANADLRVKGKQQDVAQLRSEVDEKQRQQAERGGSAARLEQLTKKVDSASATAGVSPVSGSGLSVTLDDSKESVDSLPSDGSPDWLVVHQQDVQGVVNALWRGGARGIQLMDQRVVSTSAVRCVGNTLILQGRVYSPPFTIKAVGDPVKLQAALDDDPAVKIYREYVDLVGLGYDVKRQSALTLPAFQGSLNLKFASAAR